MCNIARNILIAVLVGCGVSAGGGEFEIDTQSSENPRFPGQTNADPDQMTSVMRWISANSVLPSTTHFPDIEIIPMERIAIHRRSLAGPGFREKSFGVASNGGGDILAFYDRGTKTIYLCDHWTGDTPVEMSILVHELVHHMQSMAEIQGHIGGGGERLAYALQDRWLRVHGTDLNTAFGIDRFSVTMLTEWLY